MKINKSILSQFLPHAMEIVVYSCISNVIDTKNFTTVELTNFYLNPSLT